MEPGNGTVLTWSSEDDQERNRNTRRPVKYRKKVCTISHSSAKTDLLHDLVESNPTNKKDTEHANQAEYLPEYLKKRKQEFEITREQYQESGLKLPPTYDDFDELEHPDFDDEDIISSRKPNFGNKRPVRQEEDFELEYSGGFIPGAIAKWLYSYQIDGAKFMHEKFVYQKGCILADDMGLGKTIQTISFLTAAFGKTSDLRDSKRMRISRQQGVWYPIVLIVCPTSLMNNWKDELDLWGYWQVDFLYASTFDDTFKLAKSGYTEICLTSYDTYRTQEAKINTICWDCVIADEFHRLKNPESTTARAMSKINALCRIGLSGTAVQNNYEELWTLLNWTSPGSFSTLSSWKNTICKPLRDGQAHGASNKALATGRRIAEKLVKNILPPFLLRRTKSLIADQLPRKRDRVVFCPLTETQSEAYLNLVESPIVQGIKAAISQCDRHPDQKGGQCCHRLLEDKPWMHHLLGAVTTLQKLCNHVCMLKPNMEDKDKDRRDKQLDFLRRAVPHDWKKIYYNTTGTMSLWTDSGFCGKWIILNKLLKFWYDSGDKVLVFSHSVRLLLMLQDLMKTTSYDISYLDGSKSIAERTAEVNRFNTDPSAFVFLISSKAGGIGLNITSANKVVIFDPHWNPSWDLQAQDRAYRLGQKRDVDVFRLVAAGTIEEIVYARQIYKQQQANIAYKASNERRYFKGIQENPAQKGEIFGIENMFAYHGEQVVLRDIVHNTNIAESKSNVMIGEMYVEQIEDEDDEILAHLSNEEIDSTSATMSQLADIITGAASKKVKTPLIGQENTNIRVMKSDGIDFILAQAGVQYTHDNAEVIGTSKTETTLSKHAMQLGSQIEDNERAFGDENDEATLRISRPKESRIFDSEDRTFADMFASPEEYALKFNPPENVRKRQFCSMARFYEYDDIVEFAVLVENMTQEQRRQCLDKFYATRRGDVVIPMLRKKHYGV